MGKTNLQEQNYVLSPEAIDDIAQALTKTCSDLGLERTKMLRYRLSVEECLLRWLEHLGAGKEVSLSAKKVLNSITFILEVEGEAYNPYSEDQNEMTFQSNSMLSDLGLMPVYAYKRGKNQLKFQLNAKKENAILKLLSIIALAFAVGLLGVYTLPEATLQAINGATVEPLFNALLTILKCIAGPMIFLSVTKGVCGIGNAYVLGKLGKKMLGSYLLVTFICICIGLASFPIIGPALSASSNVGNPVASIVEILLDIVPANIISPFVDGNTLQMVFIAFLLGLSLVVFGQRTSAIRKAVEEFSQIVNFLMGVIGKIIPLFVFLLFVETIWSGTYKVLIGALPMAVCTIGCIAISAFAIILFTAAKNKIAVGKLLKMVAPSFFMAITTASSSATFETNLTTLTKKFGIKPAVASFMLSFGTVVSKSATAILYLTTTFHVAKYYGVSADIPWLIMSVVLILVASISVPPVTGCDVMVFTLIYMQLGIPMETLTVAVALTSIMDFFSTSGNMTILLNVILNVANSEGMLDEDILQGKKIIE